MEPEVPPPSAVEVALVVGAGVGAILGGLGLLALVSIAFAALEGGGWDPELGFGVLAFLAGLVVTASIASALLAFGEALARSRIDATGQAWGALLVPLGGVVAALFAAGNVAWVAGMTTSGPTDGPGRALELLDGKQLWLLASACVAGPTVVAFVRATRSLRSPWFALMLLGALGGAGAVALEADALFVAPMCAGLYAAGAALGGRLVPVPTSLDAIPFQQRLGPFSDPYSVTPPLVLPLVLLGGLGWPGALVLAILLLILAVHVKRRLLQECPRSLAIGAPELPPAWFPRTSWEALERDLSNRGLRVVRCEAEPSLRLVPWGAGVVALARGEGASCAIVLQEPPPPGGAPPPPTLTLVTAFADDRHVVTTNRPVDGMGWLLRARGSVLDAWPKAPLDLLFARHARDVAALAALSGPPRIPGDARAWLVTGAARWAESVARLERVPAPWLLACAWWFGPPRPVRLRGPLPR